jgi:predicted nucleic acid-binding protein
VTERVFVDTSGIYAFLDADDDRHADGVAAWAALLDDMRDQRVEAVTHHAVVVEATALVQRRLGMEPVREMHRDLLAILNVQFIDRELHERAMAALFGADRRDISLVDWLSFELMRRLQIRRALVFDGDFVTQGFVPYR